MEVEPDTGDLGGEKMNKRSTTIYGAILSVMAGLCFLSACGNDSGHSAPASMETGNSGNNSGGNGNGNDSEDQCSGNVDYVITVTFDSDDHCPLAVGPAQPQGSADKCNSGKPNCVRKSTGGGPTKIRWSSDPSGVEFGVYFDPFVGPKHETKNGCVKATIAGSGNPNRIPPASTGTEVMYKYTVATLKDSASEPADCAPLDPPLIIEH